jgi:hypothetical protein
MNNVKLQLGDWTSLEGGVVQWPPTLMKPGYTLLARTHSSDRVKFFPHTNQNPKKTNAKYPRGITGQDPAAVPNTSPFHYCTGLQR